MKPMGKKLYNVYVFVETESFKKMFDWSVACVVYYVQCWGICNPRCLSARPLISLTHIQMIC
jgi:hypothetical protein